LLEPAPAAPITLRAEGDFVAWLAESGETLAVTTYNSGKLALFSAPAGRLAATCWKLPRPMGMAFDGRRLAVAARDHIGMFELAGGELSLQSAYRTGRLDMHDLAFDRRGLLFANTRFNCVARVSDRVHFRRHWQPAFVAGVQPRDCCHLNGVGVRDGRLAMATAFCERGEPEAWRAGDRFSSGVLVDIRANRTALRGLCLPHSPRWHDGRWWLCNSGEGTLVAWDRRRGRTTVVAALPGFTRGLAFAAGRAVVGLSRIRRRHILDAPPVRRRFPKLRAGVSLVDVRAGRETGYLEFVRGGREVYDVALLPPATGVELVQGEPAGVRGEPAA
jgi:uncharacterized protein (TIGR03032 family)